MIKVIQRIVIVLAVLSAGLMAAAGLKNAGVHDTDGPEITMDQDSITVPVECTDADLLAGVSAEDGQDGDVTDSLVVEELSNFIEKGRRQATVAAFDSDNNVTKTVREVIYEDYVSPRFALAEPLRFALNSDENPAASFQVTDCLDGDISGDVVITPDYYYDFSMAGEYRVVYQVSNSAGDVVELPVTLETYDPAEDNGAPRVELSEYLIYVSAGSQVNPMGYVAGISIHSTLWELGEAGNPYGAEDIEVTNPVDTSVPGVYEIGYRIPTEETYQPTIRLIVVVE